MSSYPGGKSGSGIYQRLINLIPPHRVFISAFAGQCGVTRQIRPAEHTIVIDANETVCQWWDDWRRSKQGRALEVHHCDSIEWLRYRFGLTEYSAAPDRDAREIGTAGRPSHDDAAGDGEPLTTLAEEFVFADPPYVMSERSTGRIYDCEMSDADHVRLLEILTRIQWTATPAEKKTALAQTNEGGTGKVAPKGSKYEVR